MIWIQNNYFPVGFDNYLLEKNYLVWNLSANYKVKNNINVFAKVNNIFDKNYMSATQYTATGATIGEPLAYEALLLVWNIAFKG